MGKKKEKKKQKKALKSLQEAGYITAERKVKSKCCEKYKKSEKKRCGKCPCFDLLQEVA
ncbi:hypothetical protein [Bizionia argentinensis]|uniref:hypothetical protein n=1 Tax=Bizionia argentinensis TaxID=456455 RepID=UPI000222FF5C|nr:hypothetical protein [Bizionia argentinensis]